MILLLGGAALEEIMSHFPGRSATVIQYHLQSIKTTLRKDTEEFPVRRSSAKKRGSKSQAQTKGVVSRSSTKPWTKEERERLRSLFHEGKSWDEIGAILGNRSSSACRSQFQRYFPADDLLGASEEQRANHETTTQNYNREADHEMTTSQDDGWEVDDDRINKIQGTTEIKPEPVYDWEAQVRRFAGLDTTSDAPIEVTSSPAIPPDDVAFAQSVVAEVDRLTGTTMTGEADTIQTPNVTHSPRANTGPNPSQEQQTTKRSMGSAWGSSSDLHQTVHKKRKTQADTTPGHVSQATPAPIQGPSLPTQSLPYQTHGPSQDPVSLIEDSQYHDHGTFQDPIFLEQESYPLTFTPSQGPLFSTEESYHQNHGIFQKPNFSVNDPHPHTFITGDYQPRAHNGHMKSEMEILMSQHGNPWLYPL